MSLKHCRNHFRTGRKQAAGGLMILLILLPLVISAADADALTMSRMDGSDFRVYFAKNPEGEKEKTEVLHVLGSQTAYCMNSGKTFQKGNAAAIDKSRAGWDDAHAKKAALAWYYVNKVSETSLTKREKEQIIQVMIWNIFKDKVTEHVWTLDPPKNTFVSIMEAFESWYGSNKNRYSYTASFYANEDDPAGSQAVAVFSVKELAGKIHVRKTSSDKAVSGGNDCYSLAGAVFTVYTDSACTKKAKTTGGADASMTTDASGKTGSIELSPGTYYVKETKAPSGFAPAGSAVKVTVTGGEAEQEISVQNTPVCDTGGLVIRKIDAETGQSSPAEGADLAGAEFTVRFYTGIYTKDSLPGKADRTWVIRSVKGSSGVYEASLSDACRVSGDAFYKIGGKAVLPLGTITVQETKAPEGYFLSETWKDGSGKEVSGIYLKNVKVSSGGDGGALVVGGNQISSMEQPVPKIETELADAAGSHYLSAEEGTVTLTDTVKISHFNQYTGQKVTFTGTLREQDGNVAAQGTAEVTVTEGMSTVTVPISFDAAGFAGKMLFCDEKAEDSGGNTIAVHEGTDDELQKVYFPEIGTSLADQGTGTKTVSLGDEGNVTLTDTVTYKNLEPGSRKIMKASLHDAGSGVAITGADGKTVEAEQEFTVSGDGTGSVEVTFVFPAPEELAGKDAAAFERVEDVDGRIYAVHADPEDPSQTVYAPKIRTEVRNGKNGFRTAPAGKDVSAADRIFVSNLAPDTEYRLTAKAVVRSTGKEPEVPIEARTVFRTDEGKITIAEQSAQVEGGPEIASAGEMQENGRIGGYVDVQLPVFDAEKYRGDSLVFFEKLYEVTEDASEKLTAVHEDPEDDAQTIYVPEIRTVASDAATGTHEGILSEQMVLRDQVICRSLQPECSYEVSGAAMLKEGTEPLRPVFNDSGEPLTASVRFASERDSAEEQAVMIVFPAFHAERYNGKTVVVYEKLYMVDEESGEKTLIAVHEDPEDEDQFVRIPVKPPAPEPSVITPAPETVTPVPVREQNIRRAKSVKTGDESVPEKYLLLLIAALVTGTAVFILAKVRIYLFKKRR